MNTVRETFVPKNIQQRLDNAVKNGIIVVPDNKIEFYQDYPDGDIIRHNGEIYTDLKGLFKPFFVVQFEGRHIVLSFIRSNDTFKFVGIDGHFMLDKVNIEKLVEYISSTLFTNMKHKYPEKKDLYSAHLQFKKYLSDVFENKFLFEMTSEIFSPRDVKKRFVNKEHRLHPKMLKGFSEVEVKQIKATKWSYVGWFGEELFGYTMHLENLMTEPKIYNLTPEVKNIDLKFTKKQLKDFCKYFSDCVYHHIFFEESIISNEQKLVLEQLKYKLAAEFEKHFKAYCI
jgi:hypothetical protein